MARRWWGSWASRVFVILSAAVLVLAGALAVLLVVDAQQAARTQAEEVTEGVAATIAAMPEVADALVRPAPDAALQPIADRILATADVDFVTIMTSDGTRATHPDPAEIGKPYIGTIPASPAALTEEVAGTLGPSVRTIAPVERAGRLVGWVAVGVTVGSISSSVLPRLPWVVAIAAAVVAAGLVGAALARRSTRRLAGDLAPSDIRDTLASAESMRTLGEALRAQTHEHANRMHTAVALLELGRTTEAVGILTDSARQSQVLVDQVAARRDGDPTVGALLLGKASQAAERGVEWTAEIAPDAPRSVLAPIDQVALVGNLIDNALDAARAGDEPRWVRVTMAPAPGRRLEITVADSGHGIPEHLRGRVFERGFSTKPADAAGRGVGLALVREIVESAGGSIVLDEARPTTFRIVLPTEATA